MNGFIERILDAFFLVLRVRRPLRTALATRRHPGGTVRWRLRNGASFLVRPGTADMLAVREVILRNIYRLPRGHLGTVVDLGAHIGAFTARVAPRCDRVLAFEAERANQEMLGQVQSPGARIEVFDEAVTADGRTLELFRHPTNSGQHSLLQHDPPVVGDQMTSLSVRDVIDRSGGAIDLLKVDVEGAEHEILTDELLEATRCLIVEINEISLGSRDALTERIERSGFRTEIRREILHGWKT